MLNLAKTKDQENFWKSFQPINRCAATDTYKRTMSGSSDIFADNFASYNLAARKPLKEKGADGRLIMTGLEKILYPWFKTPITSDEIEKAKDFFKKKGLVDKFPEKAWQKVLENDGYLPVDIYALPGGQTFLVKDGKHVPIASVEGPGAIVTHLEPLLESIYAPIIQATKARLFKEVVKDRFAEFGLRSDSTLNNHVTLMMALYVGGRIDKTSDDQAVFLFPDYFKDIGTVGHEFIMAYQRKDITLEKAQRQAYEEFVSKNMRSALLPDVISTIKSGLPEILKLVKKYGSDDRIIMPRFDSGDVKEQCVIWKNMTIEAGIDKISMVVEDGYTPDKARETLEYYKKHGFDEKDIIVGAGGYFQDNCNRDTISLAYKRSATEHNGIIEKSLKFSDTPGKESIPGRVRIYGDGDTIIVAQEEEKIDGIPLMKKVVDNGRIAYDENLETQAERADKTWDRYKHIEYSPMTRKIMNDRFKEKQKLVYKV